MRSRVRGGRGASRCAWPHLALKHGRALMKACWETPPQLSPGPVLHHRIPAMIAPKSVWRFFDFWLVAAVVLLTGYGILDDPQRRHRSARL